ncbi:MAG TPA: class I SAM-dependent methyltransferase [Gemmatimonadales bacterium]|nr:class I SAM-dependent methyltransferase [Gemmatimonadales bacterium]
MSDLTAVESHFKFGENWRSYARLIDDGRLAQATADLRALVGGDLAGRSFLDIGCGSGLHAAAALRLGARSVQAIDLDPDSVTATRETLGRLAPDREWSVEQRSVFELPAEWSGRFDVTYSWGVLHHTGAMWTAIDAAARTVAPRGRFVVALYRKTLLCGAWRAEKRWYTSASPEAQARARRVYVALFRVLGRLRGMDTERYIREYHSSRGMDFAHDVHDWMGGYPYESVTPDEVTDFLTARGFTRERMNAQGGARRRIGLFGSGCDEFTFARKGAA